MLEFDSIDAFETHLDRGEISNVVIQNLDLVPLTIRLLKIHFSECVFLGCTLDEQLFEHLYPSNYIFPKLSVPFNTYPNRLYNKESLYNNYNYNAPASYAQTLDKVIYDYYMSVGKQTLNIKETLARRLHDHSITDALDEFLINYDEKKVVAIMGGHNLSRTAARYRQVVDLAKTMTEEGYLMASGGGPGAMEATHVGAWLAGRTDKDVDQVLKILSKAPKYNHPDWLKTAFQVFEIFPDTAYKSLGIPTWFYGHEPPSPFATHIAKYFANSVREEGLLAIAKGGVIFAPGNAGTMQEIFQDIAQNHYKTFGYASPMVFLDKKYWTIDRPVYPAIELMAKRENLKHLDIGLYDKNTEIIAHIQRFTLA